MTSEFDSEPERRWHELLSRVLRAEEAARNSPKSRAELSLEDLVSLGTALQNALNGRPPKAWRERHPEDKRPREMLKLRREDMAAAHVLAARRGIIDDHAPNKTAREIFGVTTQAVQQWVRAEEENPGWATDRVNEAQEMGENPIARYLVDLRRFLREV